MLFSGPTTKNAGVPVDHERAILDFPAVYVVEQAVGFGVLQRILVEAWVVVPQDDEHARVVIAQVILEFLQLRKDKIQEEVILVIGGFPGGIHAVGKKIATQKKAPGFFLADQAEEGHISTGLPMKVRGEK